jgi:hypothetical protein
VKEPVPPIRIEPRWPLVLATLAVLCVLTLLPMALVWLSGGQPRWLRVERTTTLVFSVLGESVTLTTVLYLVVEMLNRPEDCDFAVSRKNL